jgi:hypothetical protein
MKIRAVLPVLLPGLLAAAFLAAVPRRTVSAQICFDPQNPNQQIPCPGQGKEKRTKTPIVYPSFTPTATSTPTQTPTAISSPTPTLTSTPVPALWTFASGSGPANGPGGFTCPPYAASVPLGAGIAALSLLILANQARIRGSKSLPSGYVRDGDQVARQIEDMKAAEEAVPTSFVRDMIAAIVVIIVDMLVSIFSFGQNLSNLITGVGKPSAIKELRPGASRLVGFAVTGMGAGVLGSALLGGLLGFDCISTNIVLPGGALLGTIFALGAAVLTQSGWQGYPLFDLMGPVNEDGSTTGSAGLHKGKDLE